MNWKLLKKNIQDLVQIACVELQILTNSTKNLGLSIVTIQAGCLEDCGDHENIEVDIDIPWPSQFSFCYRC